MELMAETKSTRPAATRRAAARKPSAARNSKPSAARQRKPSAGRNRKVGKDAVERTTELSGDVLRELEDGAQSAIEAVRKFLGTVDEALPPDRAGRSRAEDITDSALEMAQRLVHTQSEFLRKVVDSTARSLEGARKGT